MLHEAANSLPTYSLDAFQYAATTLSNHVQATLALIGPFPSNPESPALNRAAQQDSACETLGS